MAGAASRDPRVGTVIAGYRVDALIGRGGMSVVYRARDEPLERDVALKLLAPELTGNEQFRRRFLRESRVAASLHHPSIVPVYAAGEADGLLYLAMRFVDGQDLRAVLQRGGPLRPERTLALLDQVASALDAAHARGLVHRDVKPANILVEDDEPDERACLADFGLTTTHAAPAGTTASGQLVGTIDYVAPEQIRGQPVDGRADVYALGCVLYECLTGQPPFARSSAVAVLYAHLQDEPPSVRDRRPELAPEIDAELARALAKTLNDRHASAGEFVAAARAALAHRVATGGALAVKPAPILFAPAAPRPSTRMIGRERELGEVRALLRTHRLVTLVGAGGSGKTRLALALLDAAADEFPDGVWWVPLQEIRDPGLVLPAIAEAVGASAGLGEHLSTRAALLVVDNLEQVLPAADDLAGLLDVAPDVQVLATSREPLHLSLEQQYPVFPLAEPDAVTLFLERARRVRPEFEPNEAVAAVCRRLDGLPLAIELAASRVKALAVQEMLERIDRRLPLLTGGPRDAPERQRTLRATIEWSHDLLSPEEQTLFARLAVFLGGWTLEAAVAVCDADLDVLAALVDKSLVLREGERFGMLETIHEYASERIALSREEDALHERHAEHYLALARQLDETHPGPEWFDLMGRFERETANTRAAFGRLLGSRPAAALELAIPYRGRWAARDAIVERLHWLEEALPRAADASPRHRARAHRAVGNRLAELGSGEQAAGSYEASLALATRAGAELDVAVALLGLHRYNDALARFRRLGDDFGAARALHQLGYEARDRGDLVHARELLEESVFLTRRSGDPWDLAAVLHSLADCALDEGVIDEAECLYLESLDIGVRTSAFLQIANSIGGLAAVEARQGRPESAALLWRAVQAFERQSGYLPLDDSERSRYERALAHVHAHVPDNEARWADVLADAVAHARSLKADDPTATSALRLSAKPAQGPEQPLSAS